MKHFRITAAATIAALAILLTRVDAAGASGISLEGRYFASPDSQTIRITNLAGDVYRVQGVTWEGVGFFDGKRYWGVFRYGEQVDARDLAGTSGTHRGTLMPDGSLAVHGEFTTGGKGSFDAVWRRDRGPTTPAPPLQESPGPPSEDLLKLDQYVYVEELPEAVTKAPPGYPHAAREARIEGTVVVQALVGADGRIRDTRIQKSIPGLDAAAIECVRQWVFKPARNKGEPVAVWVAIPIKFTLH